MVLDDFSSGDRDNLAGLGGRKELTVVEGDVRDRSALMKALEGADTVFHLAASVSVAAGARDPASTLDVNSNGTKTALDCAKDSAERFVFASSAAAYGNQPPPVKETAPREPISVYGQSKSEAEGHCRSAFVESGLGTTVLRYFNVYGPRQRQTAESGVITRFATCLRAGETPTVFGTGRQTRDFVEVRDVVRATILAATRAEAAGKVYNVGTGRPTTINELLQIEARMFRAGTPRAVHRKAREDDILESYAHIGLIRKECGFVPEVSLEVGLHDYLEWFLGRAPPDH